MAKNTYKQDEVLEEPFDIRALYSGHHLILKNTRAGWLWRFS